MARNTRATKLVLEKKEYAALYSFADSKSPKSIRARWSRIIWMNYAVNEKALMPSVMFAIYIDGIYYANRGMYVDDATTINCEYSLNEEVLSHYDPNFVKGL